MFGQGFTAGIADEMRAVDGVEEVVALQFAPTTLTATTSPCRPWTRRAVGPLQLDVLDGGSADLEDDTVLLQRPSADDHDPDVGDTLTSRSPPAPGR